MLNPNAPIQSTYSTCLTDLEVFKQTARAMCSAPSSPRWLHPNLGVEMKTSNAKLCTAFPSDAWPCTRGHSLNYFKSFCHCEKLHQLWKSLACDLATKNPIYQYTSMHNDKQNCTCTTKNKTTTFYDQPGVYEHYFPW